MPILSDLHVHSNFSGDSQATMESQIQRAIVSGLHTITFTEHNDFDYPYREKDKQDMFLLNADSYLYDLLRMRFEYLDIIRIFFGVELGLAPELAQKNRAFIQEHEYDFVIGSSHLCHGKDPYYADFYEGRSEQEAYREYFESIMENIEAFSDFDVYGHLDYVVRYGPNKNANYSYTQYADIIDAILKRLIDSGKGIEVNTGGYRSGLDSPNPTVDILKRYKELGGEIITVGSDAHEPKYIAYYFDKVCEMLKELGFKYYTVFQRRKPEFYDL